MAIGDLTTLANAKQWLGLTGLAIASITNASPALVTLATRPSTPLLTGLAYQIEGANGMALPPAEYVVTMASPTTFTIPIDTTLLGTYTGGAIVGITDPLLQRLISATSAYIQNYLGRVIASSTYTKTFNGQGMSTLMLPQWPVTSIESMGINGAAVAARAPLVFPSTSSNGSGYTFQPEGQVALSGWLFERGYNNVAISWTGGYLIQDEEHTIPASAPYVVTTSARWSAGNRGVFYAANGAALTEVSSAPAAGQYAVDGSIYTFSAADAGIAILIDYAYVPYDIEQACIDTMGDWFMYQSRIGVTSKSIEGQSISYTNYVNTALPARAKGVLEQYRRVI